MSLEGPLIALNAMQANQVIGEYAIGGAVAAFLYVETLGEKVRCFCRPAGARHMLLPPRRGGTWIAQGNALGRRAPRVQALQGRHRPGLRPCRACRQGGRRTQGVALGYRCRAPAGRQTCRAPAGRQRCRVPAGRQKCRAPAGRQRCRAPAGRQACRAPAGRQRCRAPAGRQRCRAPAGRQRCRAPAGRQRCRVPAGRQRCRALAGRQRCRALAGRQACRALAGRQACRAPAGRQKQRTFTPNVEPGATFDLDVFIAWEPGAGGLLDVGPIYAYLSGKGYAIAGETVTIEGWDVQFLPPNTPLLEEALRQARPIEIGGVPTKIFTAEHLMAICLQTSRPKDIARLVQFMEESEFAGEKFAEIPSRHNLEDKWTQFQKRMFGHP